MIISYINTRVICPDCRLGRSESGHIVAVGPEENTLCGIDPKTGAWYADNHDDVINSALLVLCEGNPSVTGGFPSQRPVMQRFDVFFDQRLNKRLRDAIDLRGNRAQFDVAVMLETNFVSWRYFHYYPFVEGPPITDRFSPQRTSNAKFGNQNLLKKNPRRRKTWTEFVRQISMKPETSCNQGFLQSPFDVPLELITASILWPLSDHSTMHRMWGRLFGSAAMRLTGVVLCRINNCYCLGWLLWE